MTRSFFRSQLALKRRTELKAAKFPKRTRKSFGLTTSPVTLMQTLKNPKQFPMRKCWRCERKCGKAWKTTCIADAGRTVAATAVETQKENPLWPSSRYTCHHAR